MSQPLLRLRGLRREFSAGEELVTVLKDIDLDIHAGEMVAIVGASGSGKSTLMNILGCLDRPTYGTYCVAGRPTGQMTPDELAGLRREHFGFIFQRYHLLGDLCAAGNVEMPAVYAGFTRDNRRERALALLRRLGLGDRLDYRPGQLSGGQQQRVGIARALMNGGEVILADEPTGALDSNAGAEVMKILGELHAQGYTIVLVTHDAAVAGHAQRIVEICDGRIVADRSNTQIALRRVKLPSVPPAPGARWQVLRERFFEALRMAALAMSAHRMRTFLTMLGVVIGIASVVSVVALGNGSRQRVLDQIGSLGTNTIEIYPGTQLGNLGSDAVQTLRAADAVALAAQSYVDSATPSVSKSVTALYGNRSAAMQVHGVGEDFFRVTGLKLLEGSRFDADAVARMEQSVVIDESVSTQFFGPSAAGTLGKVILLGNMPCRVIGVARPENGGVFMGAQLNAWAPYSTVLGRMLGQSHVSQITVRVADDTSVVAASQAVGKFLTLRHGRKDFLVMNIAAIRETVESTSRTMTLLIGSIAAIALLVGGIGVMNIMLVSVTERTREIGLRVAVGARQSDILQQFLIEAVLVCSIGGALGVLLALGFGVAFRFVGSSGFTMIFSPFPIAAAFVCSTSIGIAFGFLPARNAARLDPVAALARE